MNVTLVERYWRGHIPTYCKSVTTALLSLGCRVAVICPYPDEVYQHLTDVNNAGSHLECIPIEEFNGPLTSSLFRTAEANDYLSPVRTALKLRSGEFQRDDLVYLNTADLFFSSPLSLFACRRVLGSNWAGMYMQPFIRTEKVYVRRKTKLQRALLRWCPWPRFTAITTLDEGVAQHLSELFKCPVVLVPDMTDESAPRVQGDDEMALRSLADGRRLIGFFGNVAKWKGVLQFLSVARMLDPEKYAFAIGGPVDDPNLKNHLYAEFKQAKKEGIRIWTRLERINDGAEYNSLVAACDLIWTVYPGHYHSSNTLTKAAMLERPVICGEHGVMGERVSSYNLGGTASAENVHEIAFQIESILQSGDNTTRRYGEYFTKHSQIQLIESIKEILEIARPW